jgi:hypothetical protein
MGGQRKFGAHRYNLEITAMAAGSASDTSAGIFVYDAFANGAATAGATNTTDPTIESITEMNLTVYTTLTGQATNFASFRVTHRNSAGTTKNGIQVTFSAAGVVVTAFVPANLVAASGATVTGAGTGTLTVNSGTALPWDLAPGDTITFDRVSNNATGLATPAAWINFLVQAKGA